MMMKWFFLLSLAMGLASPSLSAERPVRVLIWDEQQPEQKKAYGDKFLGETIAAYLVTQPGLSVKTAQLSSQEQGLSVEVLDEIDVIVWWRHVKHREVKDELAERVVERVADGRLALIALHSAHWAKPFVRLMQERAKADARKRIPEGERTTATPGPCTSIDVHPDGQRFVVTQMNGKGSYPDSGSLILFGWPP